MSDLSKVHENPENIWLPGEGVVSLDIKRAQRTVKEYDERLELAQHEVTRDWVVFIKLANGMLYPVLGFGKNVPSPDALKERLYKSDTLRHGSKILDDVNRRNAAVEAEYDKSFKEDCDTTAEAFEWGYRKLGINPTNRIFVPRGL